MELVRYHVIRAVYGLAHGWLWNSRILCKLHKEIKIGITNIFLLKPSVTNILYNKWIYTLLNVHLYFYVSAKRWSKSPPRSDCDQHIEQVCFKSLIAHNWRCIL